MRLLETPSQKCKRLYCWRCKKRVKYVGCTRGNFDPIHPDGKCGSFEVRRRKEKK